MAATQPTTDPQHIETRLLVVAEMLDQAVAEVRRALAEVKGSTPTRIEVAVTGPPQVTGVLHPTQPVEQPGSSDGD